jgi:hypothetical protein
MAKPRTDLGALISSHGTSSAFLQRAAIVAILAFFFFMTMLLVFYVRQQLIYFVLSTAFLVVYIFTMIGWVMQKRNVVSIYENGIAYRKFAAAWNEIVAVRSNQETGITITRSDGDSITIGRSVADLDSIAVLIRGQLAYFGAGK